MAARRAGRLSWDIVLDGESPPLCCVGCSTWDSESEHSPVLSCVVVKNESIPVPRGTLQLSRGRFSRLFGGSVESPVLVIGLPDGRVLWTPLRRTGHYGAQVHLLCDVGQAVVAVGHWYPDTPRKRDDQSRNDQESSIGSLPIFLPKNW